MSAEGTVDRRLTDVMCAVQMPLENLAWTIEEYLLANGTRLDTETRVLLAGVRDCADRVAGSVRQVARQSVRQSLPGAPAAHRPQAGPQAGPRSVVTA